MAVKTAIFCVSTREKASAISRIFSSTNCARLWTSSGVSPPGSISYSRPKIWTRTRSLRRFFISDLGRRLGRRDELGQRGGSGDVFFQQLVQPFQADAKPVVFAAEPFVFPDGVLKAVLFPGEILQFGLKLFFGFFRI